MDDLEDLEIDKLFENSGPFGQDTHHTQNVIIQPSNLDMALENASTASDIEALKSRIEKLEFELSKKNNEKMGTQGTSDDTNQPDEAVATNNSPVHEEMREVDQQIWTQVNYSRPKTNYGYLSVALMFTPGKNLHTIINSNSYTSTVPRWLLETMEDMQFFYDELHKVEKVHMKVQAKNSRNEIVSFEFGFVPNNYKYAILGADFFKRSVDFEAITSNHLVLNKCGEIHFIPTYLSKAINRYFIQKL